MATRTSTISARVAVMRDSADPKNVSSGSERTNCRRWGGGYRLDGDRCGHIVGPFTGTSCWGMATSSSVLCVLGLEIGDNDGDSGREVDVTVVGLCAVVELWEIVLRPARRMDLQLRQPLPQRRRAPPPGPRRRPTPASGRTASRTVRDRAAGPGRARRRPARASGRRRTRWRAALAPTTTRSMRVAERPGNCGITRVAAIDQPVADALLEQRVERLDQRVLGHGTPAGTPSSAAAAPVAARRSSSRAAGSACPRCCRAPPSGDRVEQPHLVLGPRRRDVVALHVQVPRQRRQSPAGSARRPWTGTSRRARSPGSRRSRRSADRGRPTPPAGSARAAASRWPWPARCRAAR